MPISEEIERRLRGRKWNMQFLGAGFVARLWSLDGKEILHITEPRQTFAEAAEEVADFAFIEAHVMRLLQSSALAIH